MEYDIYLNDLRNRTLEISVLNNKLNNKLNKKMNKKRSHLKEKKLLEISVKF